MTGRALRVHATNESGWSDLDLDHWAQVVTDTLVGEGVRSGGLDLLFVDAGDMAELNQQHMDQAGPTDVLSFPMDDPAAIDLTPDRFEAPDPVPIHLGDIVVCPQVADEQAPGHCGDLQAELTLLVVHGVLHVLGHDHADPDEAARMIEREHVHMARCGFAHPGPIVP
jgi:probable rRNA maturation factor